MFSNAVIDNDVFLDMPLSTQALYLHLGMKADDDGFVGSPKKIVRSVNCTEDDFKLLVSKGFVLCFESGVFLWEIAEKLEVTDGNFSRKLRRELPAEEKQRIFSLIDEIAAEKEKTA